MGVSLRAWYRVGEIGPRSPGFDPVYPKCLKWANPWTVTGVLPGAGGGRTGAALLTGTGALPVW